MDEKVTPAHLACWLKLEEAASPGPWDCIVEIQSGDGPDWIASQVYGPDDQDIIPTGLIDEAGRPVEGKPVLRPEDAEFIAAAREAVPALIAEVKRLKATVRRIRGR